MKTYFEKPTQVTFIDHFEEKSRPLGGIAYHDFIICGECGSIIEMEDADIIEIFSWIDISEEIKGYLND